MKNQYLLALLRLSLGFIFLWAFLDKLFGLGFSTLPDKSWLNGGSPTLGFLSSVKGPFSSFYNAIAGNPIADFLFMLGLILVGLSLMLGILTRIASYSGVLMTFLIWTASLPIKTNPFLDQHIIYILVLLLLANTNSGSTLGFGKPWFRLVKRNKFLI